MFRLFLWKTQKDVTMSNAFQTFLDASRQEPNRTWLDEDNEFLQDNYVKICSTNSKRKSFVTERLKGLWKKKKKQKKKKQLSDSSIGKCVYSSVRWGR